MEVPIIPYQDAEKLRPISILWMQKIANYWDKPVEYFFPDAVRAIKQDTFTKEIEVNEIRLEHQVKQQLEYRPDLGKEIEQEEMAKEMERALSTLSEREAQILRLRFGLGRTQPHTLKECGKIFSLTKDRIMQIERNAIRKLRHPSRSRVLKEHFGERNGFGVYDCVRCTYPRDDNGGPIPKEFEQTFMCDGCRKNFCDEHMNRHGCKNKKLKLGREEHEGQR